jgi:hypothetical protein
MLDHAFGIFNNVSPRFQWAEIDLPFPSDDRYFNVASYADLRVQSLYPQQRMKVKDAYQALFASPESPERDLNILRNANLDTFDMQMLIHCMYATARLIPLPLTDFRSLHACLEKHIFESLGCNYNQKHTRPARTFQNRDAKLEDIMGRNQSVLLGNRMDETWVPEDRRDVFRCGCLDTRGF